VFTASKAVLMILMMLMSAIICLMIIAQSIAQNGEQM